LQEQLELVMRQVENGIEVMAEGGQAEDSRARKER